MSHPVLEADALVAGYVGIDVLRGLSLQVRVGETVGLIGPNGAGKSTFLKAVFGFANVRAGRIRFCGEDITRVSAEQLLPLGLAYIPQGHSVFPQMTVLENLEMGAFALPRNQRQQRIAEVLEEFRALDRLCRRVAGSLSGGQQRLLEIARAWLFHPRLIMLDEPSIGLSPKLVDEAYERLVELKLKGDVSMLIVEQNVQKALEVADRIFVLDQGKERIEGTPAEIWTDKELREVYLGGTIAEGGGDI